MDLQNSTVGGSNSHSGAPSQHDAGRIRTRRTRDLSYKFQRLREKVRSAITGGELTGKLPGERILAKRFNCNAKTLSKALTDLAAEGLLERSIGRGTYVKGSVPTAADQGPWLLLCQPGQAESTLVKSLMAANPKAQVVTGEPSSRPSFINQFTAVVDLSGMAPEPFLRDLVVRGIPIVMLGYEPRTYSMDAVIVDRAYGATKLAREMVLAGHRHFVAVEERGCTAVADALRSVTSRYQAENATVDACFVDDLPAALEQGTTAVVCDSCETAELVMKKIQDMSLDIPGKISVVAVGTSDGEAPCSGYYVSVAEKTDAVLKLLKDNTPRRPTVMWLAPVQVDRGTIYPAPGVMPEMGIAPGVSMRI